MQQERLLKVGEVEAKHGFSRKTLRYWDKLGIVPPRWAGTHRVYGEKEIERLHTVRALIASGYTPKQLVAIFKASGVLPQRPLNEEVVFRGLLEQVARGATIELDVGPDFQAYNSAYKRLRRLAEEMGISPVLRKDGEHLKVSARPVRPQRVPPSTTKQPRAAEYELVDPEAVQSGGAYVVTARLERDGRPVGLRQAVGGPYSGKAEARRDAAAMRSDKGLRAAVIRRLLAQGVY